jgi:hypothetical protein
MKSVEKKILKLLIYWNENKEKLKEKQEIAFQNISS